MSYSSRFFSETKKFPASEKLEELRSLYIYIYLHNAHYVLPLALDGRYNDLLLTLPRHQTRYVRFIDDKSATGVSTTAPRKSGRIRAARWWEYTCTTVLHENSYPPWQAGKQASRQAAYKGEARPSKYICTYIFSPSARLYNIREEIAATE